MLWIDGGSAQNMRLGVGQMDVDPPVETVEEVKILSNNYAAEYGASAGGVVIETTKSGTNAYHGSAYEFLRNDKLWMRPGFFAPVVNGVKSIPELRYNIFGATIGGPVRKNKTFFFFGYEGRRLGVGAPLTDDRSHIAAAHGQLFPDHECGGRGDRDLRSLLDTTGQRQANAHAVSRQHHSSERTRSRRAEDAQLFYPLPIARPPTSPAPIIS